MWSIGYGDIYMFINLLDMVSMHRTQTVEFEYTNIDQRDSFYDKKNNDLRDLRGVWLVDQVTQNL